MGRNMKKFALIAVLLLAMPAFAADGETVPSSYSYTATAEDGTVVTGEGKGYGLGFIFSNIQFDLNAKARNGEIKDSTKFAVEIQFKGEVRKRTVWAHGKAYYEIPRGSDSTTEIPRGNGKQ